MLPILCEPVTIIGTGVPCKPRWNALNQTVIPAANLSVNRNADLIERQLVSYMARLNYGFDDRYLLTVSARQDGASQFAPGNKYSLFPSAAVAWRINNENFMRSLTWINDLKLRVGAGVTGNSAVDAYTTKGAITPLFYPFGTAITAGLFHLLFLQIRRLVGKTTQLTWVLIFYLQQGFQDQ